MSRTRDRGTSLLRAAALGLVLFAVAPAGAQTAPAWRTEFEAVCATTDSSTSLSVEELTLLVARCDKLAEAIGVEEETVRRVYLRRLKMCRDLLTFVLESKAAAVQPAAPAEATPPATPPAAVTPPAP